MPERIAPIEDAAFAMTCSPQTTPVHSEGGSC